MTCVLARIALGGLRRRPGSAALVVAVLAGAAAVLTLALAVTRVSGASWMRTFAATRGSHVEVFRTGPAGRPADAARLPGVAQSAGPWEEALTSMRLPGGGLAGARLLAGVDPHSPVARPIVTAGRWLGPGQVVVERSLASSLHLRPGDRLTIAGVPLTVSGVAVSVSREPFPQSQPGTVFVAAPDLRAIAPAASERGQVMALRLSRPQEAGAFADSLRASLPGVAASDWLHVRDAAASVDEPRRIALFSFALFLMLAAAGIVGVTVGARLLEREHEVGVLRAIGLTPRLVVLALGAEVGVLGLAGSALGLAIGRLAAPAFTEPSAALLAATGTGGLRAGDAGVVLLCVLATSALALLGPGWRIGRRSTAGVLGAGAPLSPPRLAPALTRLGLPLPVALGAGQATARRGRALLTVLSLSMTVVAAVAALSMEATFRSQERAGAAVTAPAGPAPRAVAGLAPPVFDAKAADVASSQSQLRPVVYGLGAVLLLVSLLNLLATTQLTTRERARESAIGRTIGLTPRQGLAMVASSGATLGVAAAVAGIPIGLGFFRFAMELAGGTDSAFPSILALAPLIPAAALLTAAFTLPAGLTTMRARPADLLRDQ